MSSPKKWIPVLLVGGTLAVGTALVVFSIAAKNVRWDRETLLAAAEYDGEAIFKKLHDMPAASIDFVEKDSGPRRTDSTYTKEAWASWKQTFSSAETLPAILEWHQSRLQAQGWTPGTGEDSDKTIFNKGEWTLALIRLPDGERPAPLRFRCELNWKTTVP